MPREVPVLASIAFAVSVGFGVVAPAIPVFARDFNVGHTAAAAVISAFAFMRFVSALGGGRLVDRFGERIVLSTGMFFVAGSSILAGLAQNYLQLLVLRGIGGIGSAMFTVSAVSLLLRVAAPENRGRANGLFQGGFLVGGLAGPVLGGILTEISARLSFFVYGAALAVAGTIGMLFLARTRAHDRRDLGARRDDGGHHTTLREAIGHKAFQAALVTNLGTGWALFGVRSSLVPLFVVEVMRVGPLWTGIGFLVGSAVQTLVLMPTGRFVDTVGRRPSMILGGSLAMVAMLLIAVSSSLPIYLLSMALFGVGAAHLGVAPGAVVGDVVRGRGGQVVAAFQMAADLGSIVGPLVAGMLADQLSFGAAFGATAGILLFGPLLALRMPETRWAQASTMPTEKDTTAKNQNADSSSPAASTVVATSGRAASDATAPDGVVPDGVVPDGVVPDRVAPDDRLPDQALPNVEVSDAVVPPGGVSDGISPSDGVVRAADPRGLPRQTGTGHRRPRGLSRQSRGFWKWHGLGRRGRRRPVEPACRPPGCPEQDTTCPGS